MYMCMHVYMCMPHSRSVRPVGGTVSLVLSLVPCGLGELATPPNLLLGRAAAARLGLRGVQGSLSLATAAGTTARRGGRLAVHVHTVAAARATAGLAARGRARQATTAPTAVGGGRVARGLVRGGVGC